MMFYLTNNEVEVSLAFFILGGILGTHGVIFLAVTYVLEGSTKWVRWVFVVMF